MPNYWGRIARRTPSLPARCYRDLDGKVCGAELRMVVTRSPIPEYAELLVLRCPQHIHRVQGILQYVPESWADDDGQGDATSYGV